jgi:hypothetical protein
MPIYMTAFPLGAVAPAGSSAIVQQKAVAAFVYDNTTVDLTDGMLVEADLTTSTYGLGKHVVKSTTTIGSKVVGPVDEAVDASTLSEDKGIYRTINVVVAGVKKNVLTDGSTTAGSAQTQSSGTAGAATDMAGGDEHQTFGIALEADSGTPTTADILILPRWLI